MKVKKRFLKIKNPETGEWEAIPALQGKDGLTTAISLNGEIYTQSNGVITLPNMSIEIDYDSLLAFDTQEIVVKDSIGYLDEDNNIVLIYY